MFLTGFGTAVPSTRYSQSECWEAVRASGPYSARSARAQAILRKVLLGNNGITHRHLALAPLTQAFDLTPDVLHERFKEHAPRLACTAAARALASACLPAHGVDALLVATCTGYLCPGLTSYLAEELGLRANLHALDLVGLGCGAALPTLATAEALLAGAGARNVLVVCVEVCSAALFFDDDPGVLISACLFGDGAAAVVCSTEPSGQTRRVRWRGGASRLVPAERNTLRFETRGGMLRNILTLQVPAAAADHARTLRDEMLLAAGLSRTDIRAWILHPGGRDVLIALGTRLGLDETDLRHSITVLRDHGNMSSPSVLFALVAALAEPEPAGVWWMSSFGAGFTCHGALLDVG